MNEAAAADGNCSTSISKSSRPDRKSRESSRDLNKKYLRTSQRRRTLGNDQVSDETDKLRLVNAMTRRRGLPQCLLDHQIVTRLGEYWHINFFVTSKEVSIFHKLAHIGANVKHYHLSTITSWYSALGNQPLTQPLAEKLLQLWTTKRSCSIKGESGSKCRKAHGGTI